nr:putative DNA-directed RNA polymerases III, 39 kDa polypeptide [Cryptomonas curvata]
MTIPFFYIPIMPIFTPNDFLNFNFEKSSIIAACCEDNQFSNKLSNTIFPSILNNNSIEVILGELFLLSVLNELKISKSNELFKKKIFCNFTHEKVAAQENYYFENRMILEGRKNSKFKNIHLQKNVFENENTMEFFYKEKEICFMERELFIYISKSKHRGCDRADLNVFTNDSKLVSSICKRLFSRIFLSLKIKKSEYLCKFFNLCTHSFELPPCINCPVLVECHPQGVINPFDCQHMVDWNYTKL